MGDGKWNTRYYWWICDSLVLFQRALRQDKVQWVVTKLAVVFIVGDADIKRFWPPSGRADHGHSAIWSRPFRRALLPIRVTLYAVSFCWKVNFVDDKWSCKRENQALKSVKLNKGVIIYYKVFKLHGNKIKTSRNLLLFLTVWMLLWALSNWNLRR